MKQETQPAAGVTAGGDSADCLVRSSYLYELWEYLHNNHGLRLPESELMEICQIVQPSKSAVSAVQKAAEYGKPYICRGTGNGAREDFRWAFTIEHEAQGRFQWAQKIPYGYGSTIERAAENFLAKLDQAPLRVRRRLGVVNVRDNQQPETKP
jgi:hypothetical protein